MLLEEKRYKTIVPDWEMYFKVLFSNVVKSTEIVIAKKLCDFGNDGSCANQVSVIEKLYEKMEEAKKKFLLGFHRPRERV